MQSEKKSARILAELLKQHRATRIVFSPGSRNAPLVIQFNNDPAFETLCIPDERVAAFFAMGMAQWDQKPVVLCCTSGTATLNYAPAIAEAYYQKIPLVVLTADRPMEWIDHGEGQSIRQYKIYDNYIKGSYQLPQNITKDNMEWLCGRLVNEALNLALTPALGPVHLNVSFDEPLYGETDQGLTPKFTKLHGTQPELQDWNDLKNRWRNASKKLILCGLLHPDHGLEEMLKQVNQDPSVTVLTETTANLFDRDFNGNVDRLIASFPEQPDSFMPEVVVTIGGAVISKKIKALFRQYKPAHWHVSPDGRAQDMFQSLTDIIPIEPRTFLKEMLATTEENSSEFGNNWKASDWKTRECHEAFMKDVEFSDLLAYDQVLQAIPDNSILHMGNSTAVRYVQLFDQIRSVKYFCNRGTSGIDGSTSTALGSAHASGQATILVTGDMSFIYDSNAFWNSPISQNFKAIVFNNSGGGIFRIIDGPSSTNHLETYFENRHDIKAEGVCRMFGINYHSATNQQELESALALLFEPSHNDPAVLEVFTDPEANPRVLANYFKYMSHE